MRISEYKHQLRELNAFHNVCEVSAAVLAEILAQCASKPQILFPRGIIANHNRVFGIRKDNVPLLTFLNTILAERPNGVPPLSLSLGATITTDEDKAWRLSCDYYGQADMDLMFSYVAKHLQKAMALPERKDLYLLVAVREEFEQKYGLDEMSSQLGRRLGISLNSVKAVPWVICQYGGTIQDQLNKKSGHPARILSML